MPLGRDKRSDKSHFVFFRDALRLLDRFALGDPLAVEDVVECGARNPRVMRDVAADSPRAGRQNMDRDAAGLQHALQFRLERMDVRNVLQDIRAENDIEIIVRERNNEAVVLDDRPYPIRFVIAGRDVDRRDAKTELAQFSRLPARPRADLEDLRAFAQVRGDSLELVLSYMGHVFDGIHVRYLRTRQPSETKGSGGYPNRFANILRRRLGGGKVEESPAPELEGNQQPQLGIAAAAAFVDAQELLDMVGIENAALAAPLRQQKIPDEAR